MAQSLTQKLSNAQRNEQVALDNLTHAAEAYAAVGGCTEEGIAALIAAAKKHTNAAHQTSRCRKHVAEAAR